MNNFNLGDLVIALQGRDSGNIFVVYHIYNENYVAIVNGKNRKLNKPKKKNIKHIKSLNINDKTLTEKLFNNCKVLDASIRKVIANKE